MKILYILFSIFFSYSIACSQGVVFKDNFPNGKPELNWSFFPHFNLDNIEGFNDSESPDGDNGIGILKNANAGGFASLSYAVTKVVSNFTLEVMIYCPVTENDRGPLSGIAFLIDPIKGSFYRIVCDFKRVDPNINIAYVGIDTKNYPVYLRFWREKEIPKGLPKESKWQKVIVNVKDGLATIYWNGVQLPGGQIPVDKIKAGFAGVYTNFVGGLGKATTKIDGFLLKEE